MEILEYDPTTEGWVRVEAIEHPFPVISDGVIGGHRGAIGWENPMGTANGELCEADSGGIRFMVREGHWEMAVEMTTE